MSTNTASPIGESLHRLLHAYKRAMREEYDAADIGLTVSHARVLKGVAGLEDGTAQRIAVRMRQNKGRIARLIKDLVGEGLVERRPHPSDSRSQQLTLTETGREKRARIATIEAQAAARMAEGLAERDMLRFIELAEAMINNLEQPQDPT